MRIGLRIVMSPYAAMLEIHGFRQVGGQRQSAIVRHIIQPLHDLRNSTPGPGGLAVLLEERDFDLLFGAGKSILHGKRLWLFGKVGNAKTIVEEGVTLHID